MGTKLKSKQKGFTQHLASRLSGRSAVSAKRKDSALGAGFTIIEVSIVLAIAGLIMAIVFFAVPALERNARNTQRANDATHLAGLVTDYQANHNGSLSASMPLSGDKYSNWTTNPTIVTVTSGNNGVSYGSLTAGAVNIAASCDRSSGTITYNPTNTNHFAIGYTVETSSGTQTVCIDGS